MDMMDPLLMILYWLRLSRIRFVGARSQCGMEDGWNSEDREVSRKKTIGLRMAAPLQVQSMIFLSRMKVTGHASYKGWQS